MKPIFSHPGVPLIDHLKAVATGCEQISHSTNHRFTFLSAEQVHFFFKLCGALHDFGKSTTYFQAYLADAEKEEGQHNELKNHALPSAMFAWYIGYQYLLNQGIEEVKAVGISSIAFAVIKRHHGKLENWEDEFTNVELKTLDRDRLGTQFLAIDEKFAEECVAHFDLNVSFNEFKEWFLDDDDQETLFELLDEFFDEPLLPWQESYAFYTLLYGALLYADRTDVILQGNLPTLRPLHIEQLTQYRTAHKFHLPTSELNQEKNKAYHEVLNAVETTFVAHKRFYSITLPTGLGKTLTAMGAALKLKEIAQLNGSTIIAIPFTSIIDQNAAVYQDVLKSKGDSTVLLKHHHLAEPFYKENEYQRNQNESLHLIETWQSSCVVTTFVQLLESIISNNKKRMMKLPALCNAVILLDEVQQIPYQYWKVVNQSLHAITQHYNCYVILLTATQPLLFDPEHEITELVKNKKRYFKLFNRTKLINRTKDNVTQEEFIDDVLTYIETNPKHDVLIILNTKKTVLEVYQTLYETLQDDEEIAFRYLTTLITPFERKTIIQELKQPNKATRFVVVSTQLVEAGVDISVDAVFRNLAPMDSLIQAAGRANRYEEKQHVAPVFVYDIEESKPTTKMVYGQELISTTKYVLSAFDEIQERGYLQLIEQYFLEVKAISEGSNQHYKELTKLEFKKLGEFELIKERETASVFCILNEEANTLWQTYVQLMEEGILPFERKKAFQAIKNKFYDYVINVPIGDFDAVIPQQHGFYCWQNNNEDIYQFYRYSALHPMENTGYVKSKACSTF